MTTLRRCSRQVVAAMSLLLIALPVGGAAAPPAPDPNALLDRDYVFSITRVCVQAAVAGEVFGPAPLFRVPPGGATTRTSISEGVFSYNGDGTGSMTATSLQINHDRTSPFSRPVSLSTATADLTFTVNPDRSFTQELVNVSFTIVTGAPGLTGTSMSGPIEGRIAPGERTLVFKETEVDRETVFIDQISSTFERICARSGTAVEIG